MERNTPEHASPRAATPRERPAPGGEPALTTTETLMILGVLGVALASCWMLYGPMITQMVEFMAAALGGR